MFTVRFMKFFVNGTLKGLGCDASIKFPSLDTAIEYTKFLLDHTEKPVRAYSSSHYTCHCIYIEAPNTEPKIEQFPNDDIPF